MCGILLHSEPERIPPSLKLWRTRKRAWQRTVIAIAKANDKKEAATNCGSFL